MVPLSAARTALYRGRHRRRGPRGFVRAAAEESEGHARLSRREHAVGGGGSGGGTNLRRDARGDPKSAATAIDTCARALTNRDPGNDAAGRAAKHLDQANAVWTRPGQGFLRGQPSRSAGVRASKQELRTTRYGRFGVHRIDAKDA